MITWFTVKVKYTKEFQDGQIKRVSEPYLVDAPSFTEAEAKIYDELGSSVRGEFLITNIAKTEIADIFQYDDSDQWYKCKITYTSENADNGEEKKINQFFLITARNVKEAYERLHENLKPLMSAFEVVSIATSPIVEIFPHTGEERETDNTSYSESYEEENPGASIEVEEENL